MNRKIGRSEAVTGSGRAALQLTASVLPSFLFILSCVPPPRMCAQESDCGSQASCVAGRCVAHGATPAIDTARRLLYAPVDVGYVQRGEGRGAGRSPPWGGRGSRRSRSCASRWRSPRRPRSSRPTCCSIATPASTPTTTPIALHVARVATAWDGRTLTWATQPHVEDVGAPITRVSAAAGPAGAPRRARPRAALAQAGAGRARPRRRDRGGEPRRAWRSRWRRSTSRATGTIRSSRRSRPPRRSGRPSTRAPRRPPSWASRGGSSKGRGSSST